jgi:uncharacterized membrane protein YhaH (DUF805 family)
MQQLVPLLRRSLSLSGCAGREEFIAVLLVTAAVDLVLWFAIGVGHVPVPRFPAFYVVLLGGKGALALLLTVAVHYPLFATGVRRCHDGDSSGWSLLFFVVLLPWLGSSAISAAFGMLIGQSPAAPNRYDPDRRSPLPEGTAA